MLSTVNLWAIRIQSRSPLTVGPKTACVPKRGGAQFGLKEPAEKVNFIAANGSPIEHFGDRVVTVDSPF